MASFYERAQNLVDDHQDRQAAADIANQKAQTLTEAEVGAILSKTAEPAARGEFELFKTTSIFDATAANPAWLGEEPQRVRQMMPAE